MRQDLLLDPEELEVSLDLLDLLDLLDAPEEPESDDVELESDDLDSDFLESDFESDEDSDVSDLLEPRPLPVPERLSVL